MRLGKANFSDIRTSNTALVMWHAIHSAPISRADIAQRTGLTRATVSSLIAELIGLNFLEEIGERSEKSVGKRALLLRVRTDKVFTLSVEFYSSMIAVAKVDLCGAIQSRLVRQVPDGISAEDIFSELFSMLDSYIDELRVSGCLVYGIGIATPSPVRNNTMYYSKHFSALCGIDLLEKLRARYDCRIMIVNNADAAALAENKYGNHPGTDCLAFFWVGQGIGCGLIRDGKLIVGKSGACTEFGHITIKPGSTHTCFCGKRGCLASYGSDRALGRLLLENSSTWETVSVKDGVYEIDYAAVTALFSNGTEEQKRVIDSAVHEVAFYLGAGVANLINTVVPDSIVIQGEIMQMPHFIEYVRESCAQSIHPLFDGLYTISPSTLGKDAVLLGASVSLLEELYADPYLAAQT